MFQSGINKLTTSKKVLPGNKFLAKPQYNNFCKENYKLKSVKESVTEKVKNAKE